MVTAKNGVAVAVQRFFGIFFRGFGFDNFRECVSWIFSSQPPFFCFGVFCFVAFVFGFRVLEGLG